MKIRLIVPVIYHYCLYRPGTVLDLGPLEGARWVHDKVAVPEVQENRGQSTRPSSRQAFWYT